MSTVSGNAEAEKALHKRIVHIGFGAFHRAHQALVTQAANEATGSDWQITAVNLRSGTAVIGSLKQQHYRYYILECGAEQQHCREISCVTAGLHPQTHSRDAVIAAMAAEEVAIVSVTVTEKGYCIDPATTRLDMKNPAVAADLADPARPATATGFIVAALARRRELGYGPFTVLSCDNIPQNGRVIETAVLDYASACDPGLAEWIRAEVSFPDTMVDRIVPSMNEESRVMLEQACGGPDQVGVVCEPFLQWMIEDRFCAGRPEWQLGGACFVADVRPYEAMKLRMLNGSHSFLAYLGYLAGYTYIADVMQNPDFHKAAAGLMLEEQAMTLDKDLDMDLPAYAAELLQRYENPHLHHKTWQIAMDGSQKLPQRLLHPIRELLRQGRSFRFAALGVAGWLRYISGTGEQQQEIDVQDPMAAQFREIYRQYGFNRKGAEQILSLKSIFSDDLPADERFINTVLELFDKLLQQGAAATVAEVVREGEQ